MSNNKKSTILLLALVGLSILSCSNEPKKWVAIGDSITYLNDHPDQTDNRITKGYLTLVTEALPNLQYTNKGFNGWTARDVARDIDKLGLESADIYTVFLGTNDWWQGRPIGTLTDYKNNTGNETFFGSYRTIMDRLRQLNANAQIVLITPMQRVDFVSLGNMDNRAYGSYKEKNNQTLKAFAQAVATIAAEERVGLIDLYHDSGMTHENLVRFKRVKDTETGTYKDLPYPEFIDVPFDPSSDEYPYPPEAIDMTYDGLHPSDKGYRVIADMVIQQLKSH